MNYLKYTSPSFIDAYKMAFTNCTNFEDRSRRSEYWKFIAIYDLIFVLLIVLGLTLGSNGYKPDTFMAVLIGVFGITHLLPNLSLLTRRMHDVGHSAKWIFVTLIPCIGTIVGVIIFVWTLCDSDKEENEWGESPKYYINED